MYEIKGANGKLRPTTLRDARKLNLVPSVTTVMSVQDKPALLNWLKNELLEACISNPFDPMHQTAEVWKRQVLEQSRRKTQLAQDRGSAIHNELELMLSGQGWSDRETAKICYPVLAFLKEHFPDAKWVTEKSFTNLEHGFGGCVDLHCPETNIVLDFKTKMKPADEIEKLAAYDDHHMQTAAYVVGLGMPKESRRFNLFVGYELDKDGNLVYTGLKLTESLDFNREWDMFETLLKFWKLKHNYNPGGVS